MSAADFRRVVHEVCDLEQAHASLGELAAEGVAVICLG